MRLLHIVATDQRRGAEIFAADLISVLEEHQVEQHVAVIRTTNGQSLRYGAPVTLLPWGRVSAPAVNVNLSCARALARLAGSWRPDIIQAHGAEALKYTVFSVRGRDGRIVYRRIGSWPAEMSPPRRAAYRVMMRRPARIVAVGEALRKETIKFFRVPANRVLPIPNAVDSRRLASGRSRELTRRTLGIPPEAAVVLSLGALTWEKDPLAHLDIAARVLQARPDAVHLFAGDGPLRARVEEAISRLPSPGRVRLLGSRSDVADLLTACDVLLLASRVEGMPASVIEAGMLGVPVAAFALAEIPEVIVDGETGRLAPSGDVDSLAQHVIELLSSPERRAAMGSLARERCRRRFDIRVIGPRYLGVYNELVAGNGGATRPERPRTERGGPTREARSEENVDGGTS
jgi:glycosyltransferase involved in cell wall biosynthesis